MIGSEGFIGGFEFAVEKLPLAVPPVNDSLSYRQGNVKINNYEVVS